MKSKADKIIELKEIILALNLRELKDKELISSLVNLKIVLNDFFSVFSFPRGTKHLFYDATLTKAMREEKK